MLDYCRTFGGGTRHRGGQLQKFGLLVAGACGLLALFLGWRYATVVEIRLFALGEADGRVRW